MDSRLDQLVFSRKLRISDVISGRSLINFLNVVYFDQWILALLQLLPQHKYISDKSKALHFLFEQLDKLNTKKYVYGKGNRHSSVAPQCSYMVLTIPKKNK